MPILNRRLNLLAEPAPMKIGVGVFLDVFSYTPVEPPRCRLVILRMQIGIEEMTK